MYRVAEKYNIPGRVVDPVVLHFTSAKREPVPDRRDGIPPQRVTLWTVKNISGLCFDQLEIYIRSSYHETWYWDLNISNHSRFLQGEHRSVAS
jgi:hypothetical protein